MTKYSNIREFGQLLLEWSRLNPRRLPWKKDRDPYKIWVSEIILQQTRVKQGLPYYQRFIQNFPSLEILAQAKEDDLMQVWQGLGYYSRARNMHFTARYITEHLDGKFPQKYEEIIQLKGIGPYTAAAIASFAFGEKKAVVDGNVIRVLSRMWGIFADYSKTPGKKTFQDLADSLIAEQDPAVFNQAIMDFGATQCIPGRPDCSNCPMISHCYAYQNKKTALLPFKTKGIPIRNRFMEFYAFIMPDNRLILHKRTKKDIWKGLYDLPSIELNGDSEPKKRTKELQRLLNQLDIIEKQEIKLNIERKHLLTHQKIHAKLRLFHVKRKSSPLAADFYLVDYKNLCNFAYPKLIDWFIEEKILPLIGNKRNQNDQ